MKNNYGGKANSLIKLKNNGFNVPEFFIISSEEYKKFLIENNLEETIKKLILEQNYEEIKRLILNSKINASLEEKIKSNFFKLNTKYVSVRSSADNEDGKDKSFAGQYNTFLNVKEENLLEKIKLCWSSLYTESVITYADEINISGMNVVIQTMVESDYAGVMFSVDPTSDTNNYSIIEITHGLGESLVSGEITPTKYIIRRNTKYPDLILGEQIIKQELVIELETLLLNIEKVYELPVDVEFAIKNEEIFILQTRPITAFTPLTKTFFLSISRPKSLIEESIYFKGEYEGIKSITRNLYYFKPLLMYNTKNKNTEIYYNEIDLEEDPEMMYYYMDLDYDLVLKKYEEIKVKIKNLDNIIDNNLDFEIGEFISDLIKIYPFSSLGQLAGHFENISERLKNTLIDFRYNYDYIIHKSSDYLLEKIIEKLPQEYKEYAKYIEIDEYINKKLPTIEELNKRTQGYIYYGKLYVTSDYNKWLEDNNIVIKKDEETSLKGQVVFSGNVEGRVCKIYSEEDFNKFTQGDILVTPMTTPKFVKLIKQAKAIITDEGGTTCHAAIVSRELKIPCIVGCKNVTKELNDGDYIKLNGSTGEIEILKTEE